MARLGATGRVLVPLGLQRCGRPCSPVAGALILGQAWLVWNGRKVSDAHVRRSFVQAYAVVFALTSLSLARAQLTEGGHFNAWNWINILFFAGLSAMYSWFVFVEPIATFELPNRVLA